MVSALYILLHAFCSIHIRHPSSCKRGLGSHRYNGVLQCSACVLWMLLVAVSMSCINAANTYHCCHGWPVRYASNTCTNFSSSSFVQLAVIVAGYVQTERAWLWPTPHAMAQSHHRRSPGWRALRGPRQCTVDVGMYVPTARSMHAHISWHSLQHDHAGHRNCHALPCTRMSQAGTSMRLVAGYRAYMHAAPLQSPTCTSTHLRHNWRSDSGETGAEIRWADTGQHC